jgi:hypothetical protein
MANRVRLDKPGLAAILNSAEVGALVEALGHDVGGNVGSYTTSDGKVVPVRVTRRVASGGRLSVRPAVDVTLAHPAGRNVEAKHGVLARAAASAGLTVKGGA